VFIVLPYPNEDIGFSLTYKKVKNINLRIDREGNVKVSAPKGAGKEQIIAFVAKNAGKIRAAKASIRPPFCVKDGMKLSICGKAYTLRIGPAAKTQSGVIALKLPDKQAFVREVKKLALPEIEALCRQVYPHFKDVCPAFPTVKLRQMTTQWGNCRADSGILTFSVNLCFAPTKAIQYVVVHEFCHFAHQNHSAAFYKRLSRHMPDYKARRELLKRPNIFIS